MCKICNNTGLLPLKDKNGFIVPHAFIDCECKPFPSNNFSPLKPEDIDFPVSRSFYRSLALEHHWADPGPMIQPTERIEPQSQLVKIQHVMQPYQSPLSPHKKNSGIPL